MELNKNDSLFTYIDSNDTQDLYTKYINKKIPKLSKYAEIYLANLEKEKIDEGENSNNSSKNNINLNNDNNDYNSSIKDFSNDITNNDSIINNNFQINKLKNEPFKNETIESNKSNTINYLAIEQLKKNIEIKTKKPIIISKVNNFTINYNDNKISDYKAKISEQISNHYKKMVPAMRNKIKSRLFFFGDKRATVLDFIIDLAKGFDDLSFSFFSPFLSAVSFFSFGSVLILILNNFDFLPSGALVFIAMLFLNLSLSGFSDFSAFSDFSPLFNLFLPKLTVVLFLLIPFAAGAAGFFSDFFSFSCIFNKIVFVISLQEFTLSITGK